MKKRVKFSEVKIGELFSSNKHAPVDMPIPLTYRKISDIDGQETEQYSWLTWLIWPKHVLNRIEKFSTDKIVSVKNDGA